MIGWRIPRHFLDQSHVSPSPSAGYTHLLWGKRVALVQNRVDMILSAEITQKFRSLHVWFAREPKKKKIGVNFLRSLS